MIELELYIKDECINLEWYIEDDCINLEWCGALKMIALINHGTSKINALILKDYIQESCYYLARFLFHYCPRILQVPTHIIHDLGKVFH